MLNEPPSEGERPVHPLEQSTSETEAPTNPPVETTSQADNIQKKKLHPLHQQAIDSRNVQQQAPAQPDQQRITFHMQLIKPRLLFALIAINAAIYVLAFMIMDDLQRQELYDWGVNNSIFVFEFGEYHRLFTAMFLHGDLIHVAFNMMAVYYIGQNVESVYGIRRFALIYFLGGLMGSLFSVLVNSNLIFNNTPISSVGASGAVFAIVGAEAVFLYKHRKLFRQQAQSRLRSLIIIIILNLSIGFAGNNFAEGVRLDNWGHIGGLVGGVILAWYICPDLIPKRHPTRANAFLIADTNPLEKHYQTVILFVSSLLGLLIIGTLLAS